MKNIWRACIIGTTVYAVVWTAIVLAVTHTITGSNLKNLALSAVAVCVGIAFGALARQDADKHRS